MEEDTCPACGAEVFDIDTQCPKCGEALTSEETRQRIGSTMLEHYEVTDVLGQGGMSVVYKGRHKITGQEVALKLLPPELAAYQQVKSRFLEEARTLAQLDHPNIVHLYNFGQDDAGLVLAMQFVRGDTWERLIFERERLSWVASARIAIDVLGALDFAHTRGVIHRDMKPSNVLVREDGPALVMDFGIAKMNDASTRLTATGQTMGTVRYMSPEQVRGQDVDARTDVYSFAITLYESLVGDTPFDGDSHFDIMSAHLTKAPPTPTERGVELPPGLEEVLMAAMSKEPDKRPATAKQLRAQLEDILKLHGPKATADRGTVDIAPTLPAGSRAAAKSAPTEIARVPGAGPRSGSLFWIAVGGAALVAGALVTFLVLRSQKQADPPGDKPVAQGGGSDATSKQEAFPQPVLPEGVQFAVNQRFEGDRVHVIAVSAERDAQSLRQQVLDGRRDFSKKLKTAGLAGTIEHPSLSLVLVPREQMCDDWIYERGAPNDCGVRDFWYRIGDRTLYLVDESEGLSGRLAYGVALAACLENPKERRCDAVAIEFGDESMSR